jgi:hypothetical protein
MYLLQGHVARNLENHDTHEQQLVAQVDRVLIYTDVHGEAISQGAGKVHSIDLEDQEAQE